MKKISAFILSILIIIPVFIGILLLTSSSKNNYGAPPYIEDEVETAQSDGKFGDLSKWVRPEGPLRVGLQVGHFKNNELPDELSRLRETGGGTSNGSVAEWEVNLSIAQETKEILEKQGIVVDILPATIPPGYLADAVVAIHADGSLSSDKSGFKVVAPRRDMIGKAADLVKIIEEVYQKQTNLEIDPNITRNMTGYYAFNWRRYEYSIHPMAPAVILETGFLTNPSDASMLIHNPEKPAAALAEALIIFLIKMDKKRSGHTRYPLHV